MSVDIGAWTTLNRVKLHLHVGLSDTAKDTFLEQLINSGYKILEDYIGYPLLQATYTEYYDGHDSNDLILKKWPVASITSIHIDSERNFTSEFLADSTNYYFDPENGIVEFYKHEGSGPGWFPCGVKNIKVVYVAGYSTFPGSVSEILDEFVAYLFVRSGTEGFIQQSMGSRSENYDNAPIPDYIKWKLAKYKNRAA